MDRLLAEDLLVLAWDDDKGAPPMAQQQTLPAGVAGALVLDAVFEGLLTIDDDRVGATGEAPHDELLAAVVTEARRRRPPKTRKLVQRLASAKRVRAVRGRLVAGGRLREERRRWLGVFPVTRHPTADLVAAQELRDGVRALLVGERSAQEADDRLVLLAALSAPTGVLERLVDRDQRRAAKRRAEGFAEGDGLTAAVGEVVRSAQAAAIAAAGAAAGAAGAASGGS